MDRAYSCRTDASKVAVRAIWLAFRYSIHGELNLRAFDATEKDMESFVCGMLPIHADYIYGRMVKLYIRRPDSRTLDLPDHEPHISYQSWAGTYPTYNALMDEAEDSLGIYSRGRP
jgi:hypothetical protein